LRTQCAVVGWAGCNISQKKVLFMEFRLTYQGPLLATQRDPINSQKDPKADNKHTLRLAFHRQLKRLWEITPFLQSEIRTRRSAGDRGEAHDIKTLAAKHNLYGFNFVPLVTHDIELFCGLEILFLRPDKPGGVVWAGDIDNRIKTLIDALRIPVAGELYTKRTQEQTKRHFSAYWRKTSSSPSYRSKQINCCNS
jgi:hypothetical protein